MFTAEKYREIEEAEKGEKAESLRLLSVRLSDGFSQLISTLISMELRVPRTPLALAPLT
jgi:hypothetical protein